MTGRFVEVVCSFDQVVPEIGRQKNISPIMVGWSIYRAGEHSTDSVLPITDIRYALSDFNAKNANS